LVSCRLGGRGRVGRVGLCWHGRRSWLGGRRGSLSRIRGRGVAGRGACGGSVGRLLGTGALGGRGAGVGSTCRSGSVGGVGRFFGARFFRGRRSASVSGGGSCVSGIGFALFGTALFCAGIGGRAVSGGLAGIRAIRSVG